MKFQLGDNCGIWQTISRPDYADGDTYYKPCYQGDELAYCVMENLNY